MKNYLHIFVNIIDIFAFYDRPVLFVSEIDKKKYICELINDADDYDEWLLSDITDQTYDSLKALEIDLHTCFKNSRSGTSVVLKVSDSCLKSTTELRSLSLADGMLPLKDIYIREKDIKPPLTCDFPHL